MRVGGGVTTSSRVLGGGGGGLVSVSLTSGCETPALVEGDKVLLTYLLSKKVLKY